VTITEEIPRDAWRAYFDDFSTRLGAVEATIEIDGRDVGAQIAAERLVFGGITYDDGDDIVVVAVDAPGSTADEYEHVIDAPQRIAVATGEGLDTTVEIQDAEGRQTPVRLGPAPALPPA